MRDQGPGGRLATPSAPPRSAMRLTQQPPDVAPSVTRGGPTEPRAQPPAARAGRGLFTTTRLDNQQLRDEGGRAGGSDVKILARALRRSRRVPDDPF